MKLLFVDTETGGIDENTNSLLTIAMVYWEDKKILDKLSLSIKEEAYNVTVKALEINNLDLKEVYRNGLFPAEAIEKINTFITKNFKNEKAVICGHNVNFDIRFLKKLYEKSGKDYEEKISYRSLDTASVFRFFSAASKFRNINSLDDAIKYFKLSFEDRHTAYGDVEKTVEVFNKMIEMI